MNIVLYEPENPLNVGNIGRTCVITGSVLHLIKPLGFFIGAKEIKRAGLDYWNSLDVRYYDNYLDFLTKNSGKTLYFASTKACKSFSEVHYDSDSFVVFGKESAGIPLDILSANFDNCIRIPMRDEFRSLNLATSVGIILYEALRQNDFPGLCKHGNLKPDFDHI